MEINNFEYGAEQKIEGKLKTRRLLLLILYVVFTASLFGIIFAIKMIPLGAVVPIFVWMLIFFTWRYVKIDHKYIIDMGNLTYTKRYGNTKPKVISEFKVKNATLIAPVEESESKVRDYEPEIEYDARPYADCVGAYVALYVNKDGKRCAFYFQATEASLKVLHYYNSECVVKKLEEN